MDAHQVSAVGAQARFFRDGTYEVALSLDVQPSADPAQNDLISPEQAVLNYLGSAVAFQFDERVVKPEFSRPVVLGGEPATSGPVPRQQLHTQAKGRIPAGAKAFYARLAPETEVALVLIVEKDGVRERRARTLFAGETSRPVDLSFLYGPPPGPEGTGVPGSADRPPPPAPSQAAWRAGAAWLLDGGGRAAVLLLALLLIGISPQAAGMQAVAFLASVFLGQVLFSAFGSGPARESLGNVLASLLLALTAMHNLRGCVRVGPARYALAGFAGFVLGHFFPGRMLPGYLGGQCLAVAGCALIIWVVLGGFWKMPWYGARLARPASWLLLGVAVWWLAAGWWR